MKLENPPIGVVDWSRNPRNYPGRWDRRRHSPNLRTWRHHVASRRLQFPASSQAIGAIKATSDHRTAFYAKPARLSSSSIDPQAPQVSLMLQSTGLLPPRATAGVELCGVCHHLPVFGLQPLNSRRGFQSALAPKH